MDVRSMPSRPWAMLPSFDQQLVTSVMKSANLAALSRRLEAEKDLLEDGLADCVIYLGVLRKKIGRTERRACDIKAMNRARRKQLKQSLRELTKEVRNREQDEQAFLNNLQTCEANLSIIRTLPYSPAAPLPFGLEDSTESTQCSNTEPSMQTECSWNGWTDDTAVSPLQRQNDNYFSTSKFGPHGCSKQDKDIEEPRSKKLSLALRTDQSIDSPVAPTPPNTTISPAVRPALSPKAAVFEPRKSLHIVRKDSAVSPLLEGKISIVRPRRATEGGEVGRSFEQLSLGPGYAFDEESALTWCNPTPEKGIDHLTDGKKMEGRGRRRSASF